MSRSMLCLAAAVAASAVWSGACAADDVPTVGPGSTQHKERQQQCANFSGRERERCLREVEAAAAKSGAHCAELTGRAAEKCMADAASTRHEQARDQSTSGQVGRDVGPIAIPPSASPGDALRRP